LIFQRCSLDLPLATVKIGDAFLVLELVFRLIFNLQSKNDNRTKKNTGLYLLTELIDF